MFDFIQNKDKFESKEHIKAWLIRVTINCSKSVFMSSWFKKIVPLEEDLTFDNPEKSDVYFAGTRPSLKISYGDTSFLL